jgi:hypothetical protein
MSASNSFDDKTIRQGLSSKSPDELADWMASAEADSPSVKDCKSGIPPTPNTFTTTGNSTTRIVVCVQQR